MRQSALGILVLLTLTFTSFANASEHQQQLTQEQEVFASAIQALTPGEIDQILLEVQDFQLRNPGVSEENLDRLVVTLVKQQVKKPIQRMDDESYTSIPRAFLELNSVEKYLCVTSPLKCAKMYSCSTKALSTAPTYFKDGCTDGRCDAFRHAYWNALMVRRIDYNFARDFAAAHEYGDPRSRPQDLDRQMDSYNNSWGQSIGQSYTTSKYTDSQVEGVVKSYVTGGKLVIIKNGKIVKSNQ